MQHPTGGFIAQDDDGQQHTIYIYPAEQPDGAGLESLETADGRRVERVEKGVYKIVRSGIILRSNAPNAP